MELVAASVSHDFGDLAVLRDISFRVASGEILALVGPSGCGKSTLLGIAGGLLKPGGGSVTTVGAAQSAGLNPVAFVFQDFALLPWRSVAANIAFVLEHTIPAGAERDAIVADVLRRTGLADFAASYPRQLSGGMRQRVGIARALVTNPDILLMDEAFSALDVLTGETLRDDILELWDSRQIPTKGILIVSHNIEEAVMMADRIIILSSEPGRIRSEIRIGLPRPRNVDSSAVRSLIDEVYGLMTMRHVQETAAGMASPAHPAFRLPETDISRIEGVLDLLAGAPFHGRADLPQLAEEAE
ncbi:MAG TPA: ATP-binding cassette domain-containing protein, partial [Stellaceae bacterium]|nr:ATP-binding cassette domain-containing protein [Stellaceae bacterium]